MDNQHTRVGFPLVCCTLEALVEEEDPVNEEMLVYGITLSMTVPLQSGVRVTVDSEGRERRMRVLNENKKVKIEALQKCKLRRIIVKTRGPGELKCTSLRVSCCCDIPEVKDMSAKRLGAPVKRRCVRCSVTEKDITSGETADERSMREAKIIRSLFLKILGNLTGYDEDENEIAREEDTGCFQEL